MSMSKANLKELFNGLTFDEVMDGFEELSNISENLLFRQSTKVVMGTDQVEAYFVFKLILLAWNMGGGDPFFGSEKGPDVLSKVGCCAFNVGALCPKCIHTSIINRPFGSHVLSLAMKYFAQNELYCVGSKDVRPGFIDILRLVKSGKLAGNFEYECPECGFEMLYETFTVEKEACGEEFIGILDTMLKDPDRKITVQDGVGFVIFDKKLLKEMNA